MLSMPNPADYLPPAMQAHLMGPVDYDDAERLQQRLVYEAGGRTDGRIHVLICEHRPIITVGRSGSHAHVRLAADELTSRQLEVRWVNRGGGCLIHGPGQIAVYPIVPLADRGWTVGEYLDRLQRGMLGTLAELGVAGEIKPGRHGVWGRGGLVAGIDRLKRHSPESGIISRSNVVSGEVPVCIPTRRESHLDGIGALNSGPSARRTRRGPERV